MTIDGNRNVTINSPNAGTYRIYSTTASTESLGVITFTGSVATFNLFLSPNATAFDESQQFASSACNGWSGLNPGVCIITLQARFTGDLSGTITADRIVRLDTSGSITAEIDQNPTSGSPVLGAVVAGGSITAPIKAFQGDISLVQCSSNLSGSVIATGANAAISRVIVGGNLTGFVGSFAGYIGDIQVGGDINNGTTSPSIRALHGIGLIEADSITSYIAAQWDGSSLAHDGRIGEVRASTGNCNAKVQASTMDASVSENGIDIKNDLTQELGFNNAGLYGTSDPYLTITTPITIQGNLGTTSAITIDCGINSILRIDGSMLANIRFRNNCMLQGQIIINGGNNGGTWPTGSLVRFYDRKDGSGNFVHLFDISGSTPYYTKTSTELGGGAIGLVPFHLHDIDCSPANNATTHGRMLVTEFIRPNPNSGAITSKSIKLHFYGPVRTDALSTDSAQPIIVEQIPDIGNPIDLTASCDITMKRGGDSGWSREIEIKGKSGAGFLHGTYRITARTTGTGRLYCDQLALATPPAVNAFTYWIDLREDCDTNGADDLDEIASHPWWDDFPENGRLDRCEWGGCPSDVNHDGFVNGDDYDLFSDWFDTGNGNADYNYDGFVNANDYDEFANDYETGC